VRKGPYTFFQEGKRGRVIKRAAASKSAGKEFKKMMRRRNLGIFFLAVSLLIPWNVAFIYYNYYTEVDLLVRKHLSEEDDDGLLSLFKENTRVLLPPGERIQQPVFSFLPVISCQFNPFLPADLKQPVLRC
jgi:hypothetical protein